MHFYPFGNSGLKRNILKESKHMALIQMILFDNFVTNKCTSEFRDECVQADYILTASLKEKRIILNRHYLQNPEKRVRRCKLEHSGYKRQCKCRLMMNMWVFNNPSWSHVLSMLRFSTDAFHVQNIHKYLRFFLSFFKALRCTFNSILFTQSAIRSVRVCVCCCSTL